MIEKLESIDLDLTSVKLCDDEIPKISYYEDFTSVGVCVNELNWRRKLDRCCFFNAISYTANGDASRKCKKLLAAKVYGEFPSTCELRMATNVHSKLFFIYDYDGDREVWMGSHNLVFGGNLHNVMLRVSRPTQQDALAVYFNMLWSQAKKVA